MFPDTYIIAQDCVEWPFVNTAAQGEKAGDLKFFIICQRFRRGRFVWLEKSVLSSGVLI